MKFYYILFLVILLAEIPYFLAKSNSQKNVIDNIIDVKDFKKLMRTKNNILVCFVGSTKPTTQITKVFRDAAVTIKGHGTMVLVDCSGEAKKMCKKLKVTPEPFVIKHYKDGDFNKDYDRRETVPSMVNFMRDPSGDLPWEEDNTANDIFHLPDAGSLTRLIKKEPKPILIMFYAPWCGFCKSLKPEYSAAATELKGHSVLAAIDVNRPENSMIRNQYNITGFPTLLYYQNGRLKFQYEGENNKNGLIHFMKDPREAPVKIKEPDWSDTDSEVVHLSADNFDPVLRDEASALVMFYAPWCGHCKRMKPEYERAAAKLKMEDIPGTLAALDATKDAAVASQFNVRGYPTIKYFVNGEFKFDVNIREANKIFEFMKDPKEPPPPPPPEKSWSEESSEVVHLIDENYKTFLKKKKHVLVMFYAPWCGHCKKAKPEFTAAAEKYKEDPKVEFAAVDCTLQQALCTVNEVKGYPTFKYFNYYKNSRPYNTGRLEADFIRFMADPENLAPSAIPSEMEEWGAYPGSSDVLKLLDSNFTSGVASKDPTLVMFYAPWCGHCKKMKPDYSKAAAAIKSLNIRARLGAVDCTTNPVVTEKYKITGFPTIKLFANGRFISDYQGARTSEELLNFMRNAPVKPKEEL